MNYKIFFNKIFEKFSYNFAKVTHSEFFNKILKSFNLKKKRFREIISVF